MSAFCRPGLVLLLLPFVACATGDCVIPKAWPTFLEGAEKLCGARDPTENPNFDKPISCAKGIIIPGLALSIANQAFLCESYCVYDGSNASLSWRWNPEHRCWDEDISCLVLEDERVFAMSVHSHLCPDCNPLVPTTALSLNVQRVKCNDLTEMSHPGFHVNTVCESKRPSDDLAMSLLNGGFQECFKWCVFSIRSPNRISWKWNADSRCWMETGHNCLTKTPEIESTNIARKTLCEVPCKDVVSERELSVEVIRRMCPAYQPTGSPQLHRGRVCKQPGEDKDLRLALANFGFTKCTAWCVFSLTEPTKRAWRWTSGGCWVIDNTCLLKGEEMNAAVATQAALCPHKELEVKRAEPPKPAQEQPQIRLPEPEGGHGVLGVMLATAGLAVVLVLRRDTD